MANAACPAVTFTARGVFGGLKSIGPIAVFVVPFGVAFGAAAIERGVSLGQTVLMSLLVFSGAAQFAALEFWDGSFLSLSLLLTVFAVSARHILMGAALSPWLNRLSRTRRLTTLSVLSDLNFADCYASLQSGDRDIGRLVGGGAALWTAWILGTAIGAIAGSSIGDPGRYGIDVVMACFFAALCIGQWEGRQDLVPTLVAGAVAVVGLHLLPSGWNILVAALAGGIAGGVRRGR